MYVLVSDLRTCLHSYGMELEKLFRLLVKIGLIRKQRIDFSQTVALMKKIFFLVIFNRGEGYLGLQI